MTAVLSGPSPRCYAYGHIGEGGIRGSPDTWGRRIASSSTKHHDQSSPGWIERMIGWPLPSACLVACLFGDESQQPTSPQVRQIRRWHHGSPAARHWGQPSTSSGSSVSWTLSRCEQAAT